MQLQKLAKQNLLEEIKNKEWTSEELDMCDELGRTALMNAAIIGNYKLVELLRAKGANVDLKDNEGRKAVNLAALHGHSVVIAYLIEGGCGG